MTGTPMTPQIDRRRFLQLAGALSGLLWTADARGQAPAPRRTPNGDLLETVPKGELPSFAKKAPKVTEAYRYAVANGETLQYMPCFCGCKNIGHRSNADCYVTERHPDGRITFNSHAVG